MVTYYSEAWLAERVENLNNSENQLKKAKKLNGKFCFRVWDGPDGKDRLAKWEFNKGKCIDYGFEAQAAPWTELREAKFEPDVVTRFSCPFDMMAKLNKGSEI